MKRIVLSLAFSALLFFSCTYDAEEELYPPNGSCNTSNVTYSATVSGLLGSYGCLSCHSGSAPEGNINLQGYTNVKAIASGGRLYGAINHSPGFHPMPEGAPKMNACDINKIKAWIDAGAPNN
jgi:hypothetical protein